MLSHFQYAGQQSAFEHALQSKLTHPGKYVADKLGLEVEGNGFVKLVSRLYVLLAYRVRTLVVRIAWMRTMARAKPFQIVKPGLHARLILMRLQKEIFRGLLGDPSSQLIASRLLLVQSLREFLGRLTFPPSSPKSAYRLCCMLDVCLCQHLLVRLSLALN